MESSNLPRRIEVKLFAQLHYLHWTTLVLIIKYKIYNKIHILDVVVQINERVYSIAIQNNQGGMGYNLLQKWAHMMNYNDHEGKAYCKRMWWVLLLIQQLLVDTTGK